MQKGRRRKKKVIVETKRITPAQKRAFRLWLMRVLSVPKFETDTTEFPLTRNVPVTIVIDGATSVVKPGPWVLGSASVFVGKVTNEESSGHISLVDRLAILTTLINYHDAWDEGVVDAFSKALVSVLLETYNSFMNGAIESKGRATKLALNVKEGKLAAFIEDGFYLSDGTQVDLTKEKGWTVAG